MQAARPLIEWPEPITQFLGFVSIFLMLGAVGFRYAVLRVPLAPVPTLDPETSERKVYVRAARRAAIMGVIGVVLALVLLATQLPQLAARQHATVLQLVLGTAQVTLQLVLLVVALVAFALAAGRASIGWPIAALCVILVQLRPALFGQFARLINPLHVLAAALWIGTLFVLVVAGLATVFGDEPSRERRGAVVADMVNGFSPFALVAGGFVVLFGILTAWQHLTPLSSLWTTPYGWTLILKLCFVAMVFSLGAWNWRRQRPTLGSDTAAGAIRRSATAELAIAGIVLVITAFLVSEPSPAQLRRRAAPPPAASSPAATVPPG